MLKKRDSDTNHNKVTFKIIEQKDLNIELKDAMRILMKFIVSLIMKELDMISNEMSL